MDSGVGGEVYLVTRGAYSDFQVAAVFSTRDKADAYLADLRASGDHDANDVEPYPLDAPREALPGAWTVCIDDHGKTLEGKPYFSGGRMPNDPPVASDRRYAPHRFYGYGLTAEHARRSAEELRRQTLALEGQVVR